MAKEKFIRNKPHLNICVIGATGHGKTSLVSALTLYQSKNGYGKYVPCGQLDSTPEEYFEESSIEIKAVEIETLKRHYAVFDCPGHRTAFKNAIRTIASMDAAIVVVDAHSGPMSLTDTHLYLAKQAGISQIIVVLNNCEKVVDKNFLELIEMEIRENLNSHNYKGNDIPVIRSSANDYLESGLWSNSIGEILAYCDEYFDMPVRGNKSPFKMKIMNKMTITGHGTVAIGCVESGTLKVDDFLELSGVYPWMRLSSIRVNVKGIETFNKKLEEAQPGDYIAVLLNCNNKDVKRGQILYTPTSLTTHHEFVAEMYVLTPEEGGRKTAFFSGFRPQFYFGGTSVTGIIDVGDRIVYPGDNIMLNGAPVRFT